MNTEILKMCKICKVELPITEFYTCKTSKDGKRGDCKKCNNKVTKEYHLKNKDKINILKKSKISIICSICNKENIICDYESRKNIRQNKKYRCKLCAATQTHLNKQKKYNIDVNFFKDIDSEIKSYLLGIIAGDGHISKKSQYLEVVSHINDVETLELFKKYISDNNIIRQHYTSKNCKKIIISSTSLCRDICRHLNIKPGKKSDKISLPNLDNKLLFHFIRGLLDSDGWVKKMSEKNKSKSCFYSSTSKLIIEQIKSLVEKENISSRIDGIKLIFSGDNAYKFLSLLYDNSNFFLSRKYKRFKEWKI